MAKPKNKSWGGQRANQTGRPSNKKQDYDEQFKKDIADVLKKLEKKHKASFLEKTFEMMYDDKTQDSVKASLFKSYSEIHALNKTETAVTGPSGPGLLLPEINGEEK